MTGKTFRQRTVAGLTWSVIGQIATQALGFVITVILARLLSPVEFGLMALVYVFTGFAGVFQELGLGAAVIQKRDVTDRHLTSVFWVNLGSGVILVAILFVLAPPIASFFDETILASLLRVVSLTFLLGSIGIVHRTILMKSLKFDRLALVATTSTLAGGVVGISMATQDFGVWSLVGQTITTSSISATLLWLLSPWRPAFSFSISALRDLWNFSLNLLGTGTINYWARRLDNVLIGRVLGTDTLGIYSKAYSVMLMPLTAVSRVVSRVMFPALSSIQQDVARVRRVYLRTTRTIALATFPLMLGLLAVVEPFVLALFGDQWRAMIPALHVFCLTGLWQSISTLNGNLYLSRGRADLQFRVGLFTKTLLILAIVVGLQWGMMGVVVAYSVASLLNTYVTFRFAGGLVGLSFAALLAKLAPVLACASVMALIVWTLGSTLTSWSPGMRLALQVPVGVVSYFALVHFLKLEAYRDVFDLLSRHIGHPR